MICYSFSLSAQNEWLETHPVSLSSVNDPILGCEEGADPEIRFFRLLEGKNFNIVLNRPISYKVKPPTRLENQNWTWTTTDVSESEVYTLNTADDSPMASVGHSSSGNDTPDLFIKNDYLPRTNGKFGEQSVIAEHFDITPISKIKNDRVVRSFFVKNEFNLHKPLEPNWFYYWSKTQPIEDLKNSLGTVKIYDVQDRCILKYVALDVNIEYDPGFSYTPPSLSNVAMGQMNTGTYGSTSTSEIVSKGKYGAISRPDPIISDASAHTSCDGNIEVMGKTIVIGYKSITIKIGQGAGIIKPGNLEGYNAFYETVAHEITHAKFNIEHNPADGIVENTDTDGDGYNDNWELNFATNYPTYAALGITFNVSTDRDKEDDYQDNYVTLECLLIGADGSVTINPSPRRKCNAGTLFEELFARDQAKQILEIAKPNLSSYDWSFDDGGFKATVNGKERSFKTQNTNW